MALTIPQIILFAGFTATAKKLFFNIASDTLDAEQLSALKTEYENRTDVFAWFVETAMSFVGFEMAEGNKEFKTPDDLAACFNENLARLIITFLHDPVGKEWVKLTMENRLKMVIDTPWFTIDEVKPFVDKLDSLRQTIE